MQSKDKFTDESLVSLAKSGDHSAMEQLLTRYSGVVRARAREFFLLGGETDDLVQEGMIGLYFAINTFQAESNKSFKNFAYLCIRRRIIDAVRSAASKSKKPLSDYISIYDPDFHLTDEENSPERYVIELESRRELWLTMSQSLSDFEFRTLSMYLNGLSYKEICDCTGKDAKCIDNALTRAKKKLSQKLGMS